MHAYKRSGYKNNVPVFLANANHIGCSLLAYFVVSQSANLFVNERGLTNLLRITLKFTFRKENFLRKK